jgi:hypothetical protein
VLNAVSLMFGLQNTLFFVRQSGSVVKHIAFCVLGTSFIINLSEKLK